MMLKDWRRAVLAVVCALPMAAVAASAGAESMLPRNSVGAGINYAQHARIGAAFGSVGAAEAVDSLSRVAVQQAPTRPAMPGVVATPLAASAAISLGGLRGLGAGQVLDIAPLVLPIASSAPSLEQRPTPLRSRDGMTPFVRFGDREQVYGLSFKIQPPNQVTEQPSPGS